MMRLLQSTTSAGRVTRVLVQSSEIQPEGCDTNQVQVALIFVDDYSEIQQLCWAAWEAVIAKTRRLLLQAYAGTV